MTSEETYLQLCVPVPKEGATGAVVAQWIERAIENRELNWVTASDVDIAGDARPELSNTAREVRVMETTSLISLLRRATQVVWATLFFCESEKQARALQPDETYEQSTAKATLVVRVFDASELHVIGREQLLRGVETQFPTGSLRICAIDELDFPE